MTLLSSINKVYVATFPVDMRKSFDTLSAIVREHLGLNPLSGSLFLFFNKKGDKVKVLFWDRNGYCQYYKRLQRGRFKRPEGGSAGARHLVIDEMALKMLLEGMDLRKVQRATPVNIGGIR